MQVTIDSKSTLQADLAAGPNMNYCLVIIKEVSGGIPPGSAYSDAVMLQQEISATRSNVNVLQNDVAAVSRRPVRRPLSPQRTPASARR